jgi:phosphohistidine swiveling domain-containing protein
MQRPRLVSTPAVRDDLVVHRRPGAGDRLRLPQSRRVPVALGDGGVCRFEGRPYFDLDALQWSLFDAFGISPTDTNRGLGGFQADIPVPPGNPNRGRAGRARVRRRLRLLRHLWTFDRRTPPRIETMLRGAREARATTLSALSLTELAAHVRRVSDLAIDYQPVLQIAATYYGAWIMALQDLLELATGDSGQTLVGQLLAASGDVASAEQGHRLQELARVAADDPQAVRTLGADDPFAWRALPLVSPFRATMERYLDDFGHRAVFEMEFASPRWSEDPSYLLEQIRFHVEDPALRNQRDHAAGIRRQAEAALAEVPWYARPFLRWLLKRARIGAGLRENAKSGSAAGVAMVRQVGLEVGRRFQQTGRLESSDDVFHLAAVDIEAFLDGTWDGAGAAALAEDRKRRLEQQRRVTPPGVITDAESLSAAPPQARDDAPSTEASTTVWTGLAAAPGVATGTARVLDDPHDGRRLQRGDVLVAPSTDPGWTPLFLRASAVVMETGGYLSHGAVVAREFGLPAVVNVRDAMRIFRDGDQLRVDGNAGEVRRTATSVTSP